MEAAGIGVTEVACPDYTAYSHHIIQAVNGWPGVIVGIRRQICVVVNRVKKII